jgi:hypothetical protein
MARKNRNNVDYFPHLLKGKKMFYLRSKFGNDGYAVWFMLLENLASSEYHYLDLSDKIQVMYLSSDFMVSEIVMLEIINILVELGEFDFELWTEEKILFSEKFVENIEDAYRKRNNECISKKSLFHLLLAKGRIKSDNFRHLSDNFRLEGAENTHSKGMERKEKESRVVITPAQDFEKIGLEVRKAYADLPEEFTSRYTENFYTSWLSINNYLDENCKFLRMWDNQLTVSEYKKIFDRAEKKEFSILQAKQALTELDASRQAKDKYNSVFHGFNTFIRTILRNV